MNLKQIINVINHLLGEITISKKEINIYDGLDEATLSGFFVGGFTKVPSVYVALSKPFTSADTNQQVGEIGKRVNQIKKRLNELGPSPDSSLIQEKQKLEGELVSLIDKSTKLVEQDIKRIDLLHPTEKKTLIEIEKRNYESRLEAEKIALNPSLSQKEKDLNVLI